MLLDLKMQTKKKSTSDPKSGEAHVQTAPKLIVASLASNASMLFGK